MNNNNNRRDATFRLMRTCLLMKLDTGGVALYRRRGTPPAGCRWKAMDGEAGLDGGQRWEASAPRETSEVGEVIDVEN
ncbi:unnamed protein product [Lactuca virosa]|uniref:Uncharacterized protein n=1 Tax=Lactuca virosa TaxID=75947 RepID=A0AAU9PHY3_9ASTR|nr:unnamed protein product [Lactuca virosa]